MAQTRLSEDWQPSDEDYDFCVVNRPDLDVKQTILQFRSYWLAQPMKAGMKSNWSRTWKNWVARARATPSYAQKVKPSGQAVKTKAQMATSALDRICFRRQNDAGIIDIN